MDKLFTIKRFTATPNPQSVVWWSAHTDYSEDFIIEQIDNGKKIQTEKWYGEKVIDHCVKFGHFGVLEHPHITLACGYFPHSLIAQIRTHRVGITFDVQSLRYTSQRFIDFYQAYQLNHMCLDQVENLVYFRPTGEYNDRNGNKYQYTYSMRLKDKHEAVRSIANYFDVIKNKGFAPEHARGMLPYDYRQHFMMTVNLRSAFHLLDLRAKKDAQLEIQQFSELLYDVLLDWCPEITAWYGDKRLGKARLSP